MNYKLARTNMVESQVRTNKVTDRGLIDALLEMPRELFVPGALQGIAYVDEDLDLGAGRCLLEPMVLARLIQSAVLQPSDKVLDVGCATGYSTAVMARLAARVVGLESVGVHAARARTLLSQLGLANAAIVESALPGGAPDRGPFNAIIVNGAVGEVPTALKDQLADGGRLLAVVRRTTGLGQATLTLRVGETYSTRVLFDAATPMLPEFELRESFVF